MEWSTSGNLHRVNGSNEKRRRVLYLPTFKNDGNVICLVSRKLLIKSHSTQVCDVSSKDDVTKTVTQIDHVMLYRGYH